jgi:hypothetical protein
MSARGVSQRRLAPPVGMTTLAATVAPCMAAPVETCAHFDCEAPATDSRRAMPLCREHYFRALQWEQS